MPEEMMCPNCGILESEGECTCFADEFGEDDGPTEQQEWEAIEGDSFMDCYQEPLDDW